MANNAKEAVIHYFTEYTDDIILKDTCLFGGITIEELNDEKIRFIHDEEKNKK